MCPLFTPMMVWLTGSWGFCRSASPESILLHIDGPGKDQNSKFKIWLLLNAYLFCTIVKLKNCGLNPCKLGTVCLCLINRLIIKSSNVFDKHQNFDVMMNINGILK